MPDTKLTITDEQARIIGTAIGQSIGERFVGMVQMTSFFRTEEDGIENLTKILGKAIGRAMRDE